MTLFRLTILLCSTLMFAGCDAEVRVVGEMDWTDLQSTDDDDEANDDVTGDQPEDEDEQVEDDEDTGDEDTVDEGNTDEQNGGDDDDATDEQTEDEDGATGDDTVSDPCTEDGVLCAQLSFPSAWAGTPRELSVTLYASLPAVAPPDFILIQDTNPVVVANGTYDVVVESGLPDSGSYHLYAVVYDVNGGTWIPSPGTDLVAETPLITFNGSAVDAGTVQMDYAPWF